MTDNNHGKVIHPLIDSVHKAMLGVTAAILTLHVASPTMAATTERRSSDDIPSSILEACDKTARSSDDYAPIVRNAINDLTDLGIFTEDEFRSVKIGFCNLRSVNGPVATTSCEEDIILLDHKYRDENERLILQVTLSHEMKHVLQHAILKSRYGEAYCVSDQYRNDRQWMEEEADAFGDRVTELLLFGRAVEIKNKCPAAVSLYLESDRPQSGNFPAGGLMKIKPGDSLVTKARSATQRFSYYAQSVAYEGKQWFWRNTKNGRRRNIEGDVYQLKRITMPSRDRSRGPFLINLTCP